MKRKTPPDRPIFLLGVGRCGSTALQLQLCKTADIWIWGEHDGVLKGFLQWAAKVRESRNLHDFSFSQSDPYPEKMSRAIAGRDATHLAWMNGFRLSDIDHLEHIVVKELCGKRLPKGKGRWGFKEIRYGIDDEVPEQLLQLYPGAKVIHTVRDPFKTIESSIFAWNFERLASGQGIETLYRHYATRWIKAVEHFDRLRNAHPDRVLFAKIEQLAEEWSAILAFLEVHEHSPVETEHRVNPGGRISDGKYASQLSQLIALRPRFADELRHAATIAGYQSSFADAHLKAAGA